jgi:hypothetical protein
MIDRHHIGRTTPTTARPRCLRLATVLAAAVALTPAAIADARPPSYIDDGSASAQSVPQYGPTARRPADSQCPCNADLPAGMSSAAFVPAPHPQIQRPGPVGPIGAPRATPPVASSEAVGSDGFDWTDAGAGAGVVAVFGGLVLAAGRVRSRPLPG